MKIIATNRKEIDVCPIDYFSIGHIIFGYISYFICYFIITTFLNIPFYREYALISTILIGIVWELFENMILVNTKLKIGGRKDTPENSQFDVVFVFAGGVICQALTFLPLGLFILVTVIFMAAGFFIFEQCSTLTINNKKKKK